MATPHQLEYQSKAFKVTLRKLIERGAPSPLDSALSVPLVTSVGLITIPVFNSNYRGEITDTLDMALPLDIDNLLDGGVDRLREVHGFLHKYDFLEFNFEHLRVDTKYNVTLAAIDLTATYADPFLGLFFYVTTLDGDALSHITIREVVAERAAAELTEGREQKFIDLLSTIDYAMERYG